MRQKICASLIITCAAIVLMSCNTSASAGAPQSNTTPVDPTTTLTAVPTFPLGQAANVGDSWSITLTSATVANSTSAAPPTAGNEYLVVALTFKNTSASSQTLSTAYSLTLTDTTGEQYNQAVVANLSQSPDGNIAAGSQVNGQVVYTVPQDQHTFSLIFQNNAALSGTVGWNITI